MHPTFDPDEECLDKRVLELVRWDLMPASGSRPLAVQIGVCGLNELLELVLTCTL